MLPIFWLDKHHQEQISVFHMTGNLQFFFNKYIYMQPEHGIYIYHRHLVYETSIKSKSLNGMRL